MKDIQLLILRIKDYMKIFNINKIPTYYSLVNFYGEPFKEMVEKNGGWNTLREKIVLKRNSKINIKKENIENGCAFLAWVYGKEEKSVSQVLRDFKLSTEPILDNLC